MLFNDYKRRHTRIVYSGNLQVESDDRALCEAIIAMAHKLGLKVIAEGVEDIGRRDFLVNAGCDLAQGFLYAKTLCAEQFESLFWER